MRGVPGITGRPKMADEAAASVSKLMQVKFPEQYGSRGLEPSNDLRIGGRNEVFQHSAGRSRSYARSLSQIFHRQRDAVQWALPLAPKDLRFRHARSFQSRLRCD